MKVLTLPGASFTRVAYVGDRRLVAVDWVRRQATTRLWDLVAGCPVRTIPWPQAWPVQALFTPGGEEFLRVQGLWPEGADLPPALPGDPGQPHPLLEPARYWRPMAFGPDGTTAIYCEQVVTGGYNSARFHLRDAAGDLEPLYHAAGIWNAVAAFSPDGTLAALSGGDRLVALVGIPKRRLAVQLERRTSGWILSSALRESSRTYLTGSSSKRTRANTAARASGPIAARASTARLRTQESSSLSAAHRTGTAGAPRLARAPRASIRISRSSSLAAMARCSQAPRASGPS